MSFFSTFVASQEEAIGRLLREGEVLAKIAEAPDASLSVKTAALTSGQLWQYYFLGTGIFILAVLLIGIIIIFVVKKPNYFGRLLSLILLLGMASSVPYGVWLNQQPTRLRTQAAPETNPKNVRVTQITNQGFTIVWQTEASTAGAIKTGLAADNLKHAFTDKQSGTMIKNHQVTAFNLESNKVYFLEIVSGDKIYNDQGQPFRIQTR
ncbi:hypothetical protein KKD62_00235 [Patescibacteria group bacterium]|nr:hypothetical protein [Patescibacteria group bacterium]MBU1931186.1 hypothetical protein [Patescibacteria group bacterium]